MTITEQLWRYVERSMWLLVAVLLHAVVLLAAYYWPITTETPPPGPLKVSLISGDNPYLNRPAPGQPGPVPPGIEAEEPQPEPEPPAPAEPQPQPQSPAPESPAVDPPDAPAVTATAGPAADLAALLAERDAPSGDVSAPASPVAPAVGVDTTSLAGRASGKVAFGNRFGQAKERAFKKFGGLPGARQAVADALAWLADHQDRDGHWDRVGFEKRCPPLDRCGNGAVDRLDRHADVGVTALCLLAFLGDGHLHTDPKDPYRDNARRAIAWLLAQQQNNGQFGVAANVVRIDADDPVNPIERKTPLLMYNHTIATLALAEAFALTRDRDLIEPVMAGVGFIARTQQPEGGWDYWPHETHRNDTSITGWAVMALKAAASAGLPVPEMTLYRSAGHFARATEPGGRVWYADRGTGVSFDRDTGLPRFRYGPAMVAVGMFSRQLLGYRTSSPAVVAGANRLLADPPSLARFRGGDSTGLHSQYYWYYGTMAMFQMGGRYWDAWSPVVQRTILSAQDRTRLADGRPRHRYGSWPAHGAGWGKSWGADGGRVYATAINTLTLEVFYRYLPLYEQPADYRYEKVVEHLLAHGRPFDRERMVGWLGELRPQLAEPLLNRLLRGDDARLRLLAAIELADYGSPLAGAELERHRNTVAGLDKLTVERAIAAIGTRPVPDTFGPVREVDAKHGLVSFDFSGNWIGFGLPVAVVGADGGQVAQATVTAIDHQTRTAIARLDKEQKESWGKITTGMEVKLLWD